MINIVIQPPYALMVGLEGVIDEGKKVSGIMIHLLLVSIEYNWNNGESISI